MHPNLPRPSDFARAVGDPQPCAERTAATEATTTTPCTWTCSVATTRRADATVAPVVSTSSTSTAAAPAGAHRRARNGPGPRRLASRAGASRPTESAAPRAVRRHGATPVGPACGGEQAGRRRSPSRSPGRRPGAGGAAPARRRHQPQRAGAGRGDRAGASSRSNPSPSAAPRAGGRSRRLRSLPAMIAARAGPRQAGQREDRRDGDAATAPALAVPGSGAQRVERRRPAAARAAGRPGRVAAQAAHHGPGPPHPGQGRGSTRSSAPRGDPADDRTGRPVAAGGVPGMGRHCQRRAARGARGRKPVHNQRGRGHVEPGDGWRAAGRVPSGGISRPRAGSAGAARGRTPPPGRPRRRTARPSLPAAPRPRGSRRRPAPAGGSSRRAAGGPGPRGAARGRRSSWAESSAHSVVPLKPSTMPDSCSCASTTMSLSVKTSPSKPSMASVNRSPAAGRRVQPRRPQLPGQPGRHERRGAGPGVPDGHPPPSRRPWYVDRGGYRRAVAWQPAGRQRVVPSRSRGLAGSSSAPAFQVRPGRHPAPGAHQHRSPRVRRAQHRVPPDRRALRHH